MDKHANLSITASVLCTWAVLLSEMQARTRDSAHDGSISASIGGSRSAVPCGMCCLYAQISKVDIRQAQSGAYPWGVVEGEEG